MALLGTSAHNSTHHRVTNKKTGSNYTRYRVQALPAGLSDTT